MLLTFKRATNIMLRAAGDKDSNCGGKEERLLSQDFEQYFSFLGTSTLIKAIQYQNKCRIGINHQRQRFNKGFPKLCAEWGCIDTRKFFDSGRDGSSGMNVKRTHLVSQSSNHGRGVTPFNGISVKEYKCAQATHLAKTICNGCR